MQSDKRIFKHESLQDGKTINTILQTIAQGLKDGVLNFDDGNDNLNMSPDGLLHLKLTASQEDGHNRFNIRVTWQDNNYTLPANQTLTINGNTKTSK
jgi:amphi-Trp domain-containing protein